MLQIDNSLFNEDHIVRISASMSGDCYRISVFTTVIQISEYLDQGRGHDKGHQFFYPSKNKAEFLTQVERICRFYDNWSLLDHVKTNVINPETENEV